MSSNYINIPTDQTSDGSNRNLSNLLSTDINVPLQTADKPSGNTNDLTVRTGNAASGNSGNLHVITGTASGTQGTLFLDGHTVDIHSGGLVFNPSYVQPYTYGGTLPALTFVGSSDAFLGTRDAITDSTTGILTVISGDNANVNNATNNTGQALFGSGSVPNPGSTGNSGFTHLFSGDAYNGNSGQLFIQSGAQFGTGSSGQVNIFSGEITTGTSGNIAIATGSSSTSGNTGNINLTVGTTSTGTRGSVFLDGNTVDIHSGGLVYNPNYNQPYSFGGILPALTFLGSNNAFVGTRDAISDATTGALVVVSGDNANNNATNSTGFTVFGSGSVPNTGSTGNSGAATFLSGDVWNGTSGEVILVSGSSLGGTGLNTTGSVIIKTGFNTTNPTNVGGIVLATGGSFISSGPVNTVKFQTGAVNFNNTVLNSVGNPIASTDAATKSYVDGKVVKMATIIDSKASGTNSGTFTSGSWQTRNLNTLVDNGSIGVSLVSNQFTLPAGTYYFNAMAPAFAVDGHMARLQNITDATTTILGSSTLANSAVSAPNQSESFVIGFFTIAGTKTFELQHQCNTTKTNTGFGFPAGITGATETFSELTIYKLS